MAEVIEDTAGKTRDLPIETRLKNLLQQACNGLGIDMVRVVSGGQCAKGTCSKRTGSTRHDLGRAADLQLLNEGRALKFTDQTDLPVFEAFVTHCAALGAQGFGAGIGYMGPDTIHVGYGGKAVWGAGGSSTNAPEWLRKAAEAGWRSTQLSIPRTYVVAARPGLRLRAGPGPEYDVLSTVGTGNLVEVSEFDGPDGEWARVDLQGDGFVDGHVMTAFLQEVDLVNGSGPEPQDDCASDAVSPAVEFSLDAQLSPRIVAKIRVGNYECVIKEDADGRVHFTADADIDADGANGQGGGRVAYNESDTGSDYLANAGLVIRNGRVVCKHEWARHVVIVGGDGQPVVFPEGVIASKTAYFHKGRSKDDPAAYVDSETVPYLVVPPSIIKGVEGIVLGCRARISFNGRSVECVVADVGPATLVGEMSIAAARGLGIPESPRNGGRKTADVDYELWPGHAAPGYRLQPS